MFKNFNSFLRYFFFPHRYRFRARPLNPSLLNQPQVPKIRKKTPTKPKNLKLRTAQRAAEIHAKKKCEEKPYEFHARPVPKAILDGPVVNISTYSNFIVLN